MLIGNNVPFLWDVTLSFDILKEGTAFVLKGQIDQTDFSLIRYTLEN